MKLLVLKDDPSIELTERLLNAFEIPTDSKKAKDIYKADALMLMWDGIDTNKQRVKETAIKLRKPIYEVLYDQIEPAYAKPTRYIRRMPTLIKEHA